MNTSHCSWDFYPYSLYFYAAKKCQRDVISLLKEQGYPSDPVNAWKAIVNKGQIESDSEEDSSNENQNDQGMDYDYLLDLSVRHLTLEKS